MEHSRDNNKQLKEIILEIIIKENNRPLPMRVLMRKLIDNYKDQLGYINQIDVDEYVEELIKDKKIFKLSQSNNLVWQLKPNFHHKELKVDIDGIKLKGIIHLNASGNGFISLTNTEKAKWFVSKENIKNAQNGDFVEFAEEDSTQKSDGNLVQGVVTNVLEHAKNLYVGEIVMNNDEKKIILDDNKSSLNVILDSYEGLVNGSKVLVKIAKYEGNDAYAGVIKIIGHKADVGVDILSIVYDNGVEPDFSDEVLDFAKKLTVLIDDKQRSIRTDLSDKPVVTIDPATSKDFDDAFYCEKQNDGKFLLSVQIADVSHYVTYDSILDKSSIARGCSVYLIDRVIPMVPHNLSDDVCSLNPNVPRMVIACDMIINNSGEYENIKVYPAIIKSHRRFSYDEVNAYIEHTDDFSKEEPAVKKSIDDSLELSKILRDMKNKRGYINFEVPKAIIKVDENGVPTQIIKETHGKAQMMIEDFMVAANEAVTINADQKNYPFIYRVHDKPDEQKIKIFSIEAKKMNFKITTSLEDIEPNSISQWLVDNKDNPNLELISMFLLRSMAKAKYDTKNIGHFGLASQNYTHFTSPIRRYPDLIVHRIYWMWDFLKHEFSDAERNKFSSELQELCEKSSRNELRAVKCERDVDAMKFAEYMSKHIGESFVGRVTSIANFGCYIQLENTIEGFVSLRSLGDDFYSYDEKSNELKGKNTGTRLYFGMKVNVECIAADKNTSKIEFKILNKVNSI